MEHEVNHRFDYLFEPLTVDVAEPATEGSEPPADPQGFTLLPVALIVTAVIVATVIVVLLQWPRASAPQVTPTPTATQVTQPVTVKPPPAETAATSAVESPPLPPAPPAIPSAPVPGTQAPPPKTAGPTQMRPPALPTTRAPISVAPETRAPLPYPPPSRDPSRPGGLLGGGGLL